MAPARKKSKLAANEHETEEVPPVAAAAEPQQTQMQHDESSRNKLQPTESNPQSSTASPRKVSAEQTNRGSWYSTSSWRSKASPVAQVAKESVSVDKGVSSDANERDAAKRKPSQSVSKSVKNTSRKSIPLAAEPTRVHANQSEVSLPPKQPKKSIAAPEEKVKLVDAPAEERKEPEAGEPLAIPEVETAMGENDDKADTANVRPASGAWFGWWSRPDGYAGSDVDRIRKTNLDGAVDSASIAAQPEGSNEGPLGDSTPLESGEVSDQLQPEMSTNNTYSRSWFRLWSSSQNQQAEVEHERRNSEQGEETIVIVEPDKTAEEINAKEQPKAEADNRDEERPKPAGWAFWSKDPPKEQKPQSDGTQREIGELAVADTPSQSHPEAAQFNQGRDDAETKKPDVTRSSSLLKLSKRGRPDKVKDLSGETTTMVTPASSQLQTPTVSEIPTPAETPEGSPAPVPKGKKVQLRPNIVSPTFRDVYPLAPNPGVVQRIAEYIAQTLHIPGYDPLRPPHPFITPTPPKVRRAIAIGVHGFFPAALVQRVLGQPTGTSIRFANYAAASIKEWCHEHQPEIKDVEIEKVALEGEGHIADRVATLWKLLLNWLSHLRKADFILVACHSQGVPVAIMLVAKLIQLGCLSPHVRIGICAMAGINLGPFLEYRSRLFGGSALELFDFCDSRSKVSMAYADSLDICLRHGVRITFIGSIDDQLVSLESSLHTPLSHPYVSRTIFIDGRLHASNFLNHLVTFAAKLRNLGVSDHGLLREISAPLAGSLVGGEGHSRVYDDSAVYRTAIEFALESTDVSHSLFLPPLAGDAVEERRKSMEALTQRRASTAAYPSNMTAANSMRRGSISSLSLNSPGIAPVIALYEAPGVVAEKNPFVLPWAVRGMLEEELVKRDPKMQVEVKELVKEFESWRPLSKVLRDVRWRLEGVRSML